MKRKNLRVYKNQFIDLYKYGFSIREIGTMYDVAPPSVKRYILEEMELRQKGLTDEQKNKLKELYTNGYNVNECRKMLGLTYSTVKHFLSKEYGVVTEGFRKYDHLRDDIIREYVNGLSAEDIGQKYGISRGTVLSYVAEDGASIRTYTETSRQYALNDDYFDVITNKNAFILGIFFAKARLQKSILSKYFIDLKVPDYRKNVLDTVIEQIYVTKDNVTLNRINTTLNLRINSDKLYNRLKDLGITYKNCMSNIRYSDEIRPFLKEFYDGVFYATYHISNEAIKITMYKEHLKELEDYMNSLGICYKIYRNTLRVGNNDDVIKLLSKHNMFCDLLKDKVAEFESMGKTNYWGRVLNFFNL